MIRRLRTAAGLTAVAALVVVLSVPPAGQKIPAGRQEVVFWHFWGGTDREVVERVVARFNQQQTPYFVRAVAMPGNNLDLKLFLAVTGGDPPDVINQDDPIVADWASRGALLPLNQVAPPDEIAALDRWLLPAARELGVYGGDYYALCNGLDVRALYYNQTELSRLGKSPPTTLAELDAIAEAGMLREADGRVTRFGYLPDPRRLWAWGVVFGGDFYDEATGRATADSPPIQSALAWMTRYRERFGVQEVAAFRQGDQSLPGKVFPLLADRYLMVMDGQWRIRDIRAAAREAVAQGRSSDQFAVCPLPPPPGGRSRAGWVNGNFFLIPQRANQPAGAWAFMKFWCGFGGFEAAAAETCIDGGWIPVSQQVIDQPAFQEYLAGEPLMQTFIDLAGSPHQIPTPLIPGAAFFQRTINDAAARAMYVPDSEPPRVLLERANREVQARLDRQRRSRAAR